MAGLRSFLIMRLVHTLMVFFFLITILFFMFSVLPGDPLTVYADLGLPADTRQAIIERFGLDRPLHVQYFSYITNVIRGDFGSSFHYRQPVWQIVQEKFWPTAWLMMACLGIAYSLGIVLGSLLARYRGTAFEALGITFALVFRSAPVFWSGLLAILIFSHRLGWFPSGGMYSIGQDLPTWSDRFLNLEFFHHLALPAFIGALFRMGTPLLLMRSSLLEVLREGYIDLARAKGLRERVVLYRHAMRNAILPIVTLFAIGVGFAMGGFMVLEVVFRWPGMGREMVRAVARNDYPLAQAIFFAMGALVVLLNLAADLVYAVLDPRISYE